MREFCRKVRGVEEKIVDFCVKHYLAILLVLATILAVVVRYKFLPYQSRDYQDFLLPWFEALRNGGGLAAVANYSGDYNAPYVIILALLTYLPFGSLAMIKAVSILFDFVLAGTVAFLVYTVAQERKDKKNCKFLAAVAYIVTLFLPQVFLNSACWGQCDAIYASFCVLALTFLIKERYLASFILLGLAFAFKLQFVFILPIFLVVYIVKRKFSIFYFLIIPLVNLVLCIPAILLGRSMMDCFLVYFNQTQTYAHMLTLNFINFYQIIGGDSSYWNLVGMILAVMICAVVLYIILHNKMELSTQKILELVIWFLIVLTFVLPSMHERYLFLGEILAIAYYIIYRKHGLIALLINVYAWITYAYYFTLSTGYQYNVLALVELFVLAYFTKQVFTSEEVVGLGSKTKMIKGSDNA